MSSIYAPSSRTIAITPYADIPEFPKRLMECATRCEHSWNAIFGGDSRECREQCYAQLKAELEWGSRAQVGRPAVQVGTPVAW